MGLNRDFLQLAKRYDDFPHIHIGGWWMSEKLDGQRAWWDGGVTRGMVARDVPWANTLRDGRLLNQPRATGLWSRYGKVIHAPDWWLDLLPKASLDGELWAGVGGYQLMRTIVGAHSGMDSSWSKIKYMAFDSPHPSLVLQDGRINNPNFQKQICSGWMRLFEGFQINSCGPGSVFESRVGGMALRLKSLENDVFKIHMQEKLPQPGDQAIERMQLALGHVLDAGGEGLIIRDSMSLWEPKRIKGCLKVKPTHDSEATVVGYVWGRETDKGSKLLGMMGAMVVRWDNGIEFELSGFTDQERAMQGDYFIPGYYSVNAGRRVDLGSWTNPLFPIGSRVTFMYRELSDDGVPKEARYMRRRDDD